MRRLIAIMMAVMIAAGLAACGSSGRNGGSGSSGYLNVMLSTNVMSLDTNLATDGESFEVIADCIDGLMQVDADGAAIPAIAESYEVSEDGTIYTFHLRDARSGRTARRSPRTILCSRGAGSAGTPVSIPICSAPASAV